MDKITNQYVALLPMKGHSERISGKNFRLLNGKPLFLWVLETILSVEKIDLVVINTDVPEKLLEHEVCQGTRVLIRERAAELVGDFVSMNRIIESDIDAFSSERYLMSHTTNPLLTANSILRGLALFDKITHAKSGDSVFSVSKYQTRFYDQNAVPINHDPANLIRTQDLPPYFEENSCLYIFSKESFKAAGARIGLSPSMLEIPRVEAIDIDTQEDWNLAEIVQRGLLETPSSK